VCVCKRQEYSGNAVSCSALQCVEVCYSARDSENGRERGLCRQVSERKGGREKQNEGVYVRVYASTFEYMRVRV